MIEEATQETWLAVVRGIDRFEGRGSLQSWIFSILVNQTRRLASREKRQAELSSAAASTRGPSAAPVDDDREPGMGADGTWEEPPTPWHVDGPDSRLLQKETLAIIEKALEEMPEAQRQVVLLCDVEGASPEDACNILGVSGTNQRVLLHRGRARIRRVLNAYLRSGETGATGSGSSRGRPS